jgi:hypothetical protein
MFELNTKHVLEKKGYYVIASRGSHGVLDLVAIHEKFVLGLQLKKNCSVSKIELDKLYNLLTPKNMFLICLIKNNETLTINFIGNEPEKLIKEQIINDLTKRGYMNE